MEADGYVVRRVASAVPVHVVLVLLLLVVAVLVAGCGDEPDGPTGADATLRIALDFTPNATHAPIFAARDQDFDTREGLRIAVQPPGRGSPAHGSCAASAWASAACLRTRRSSTP